MKTEQNRFSTHKCEGFWWIEDSLTGEWSNSMYIKKWEAKEDIKNLYNNLDLVGTMFPKPLKNGGQ